MNPYQKVKTFHINYKGHYFLDIPCGKYGLNHSDLFYCFEQGEDNDTAHTHLGITLNDPVSKYDVIEWLTPYLEVPCSLHVQPHRHWATVIGYHCGMGDKDPCDNLIFPYRMQFDQKMWIKNKVAKKRTTMCQTKLHNQLILEADLTKEVQTGFIPITQYKVIKANIEEYKNDLKKLERKVLQDTQPLLKVWGYEFRWMPNEKKRHYFVHGDSGTGKTHSLSLPLETLYHCGRRKSKGCWDFNQFTQIIIWEPVGILTDDEWLEIEQITDGTYYFNDKFKIATRLPKVTLFLISNFKSIDCIPRSYYPFYTVRFNDCMTYKIKIPQP